MGRVLVAVLVGVLLLADGDWRVSLPMVIGGPVGPAGCGTCVEDAYNCEDFASQAAAQACHDFCMEQTGEDVHELDSDGDGVACELLPLSFDGWVLRWPGNGR